MATRLFVLAILNIFILSACSSKPVVQETSSEDEQAQPEKPAPQKNTKQVWGWSYQGDKGPKNWDRLNPQYAMCGSGESQSPINLVWHKPSSPNPLQVNYQEGNAIVTNAGYTYQIELTPQSSIRFKGNDYMLEKIEFRTPSEHQLSGNNLPMELQFYHRSSNGLKQAILSLFVVKGKGSAWFDRLWENAAKVPKFKSSNSFRFNPAQLIPPRKTYYHYVGSLTHPPCLEGVQWIVFNTPLQLSQEQINQLKTTVGGNNRPVQPLNERKVTNF